MPSKVQTSALTTYDLVKSLAILLTVLDHIGYFFYPDNDWFRVLGRACIPIWCFLIGYATSRDTGKDIWIWAGGLLVINFVLGGPFFPLNILITFIVIRLVIDRLANVMFRGWEIMLYGFAALCIFILPSSTFLEYGTAALLLSLCGYIVRHRDELLVSPLAQKMFIIGAVSIHTLSQNIFFGFDSIEAKVAAFLTGATALMMYFFKPLQFVAFSNRAPRFLIDMLQFTGRYTIEIYVAHMVIFKIIAAQYGLEGYQLFGFRLFVS